MKIALIQCPLWGTYEPPMALAQLSSCLKKAGHQVRTWDLNIKLYLERTAEFKNFWAWEQGDFWYRKEQVSDYINKHADQIDRYIAQIIDEEIELAAFSVNTASLYMSNEVARRLKVKNSDMTIIYGGPLFLNKNYLAEVLSGNLVDRVVAGEGERTLIALADALSIAQEDTTVPGIAYRMNGSLVVNDPAPGIDLDALPFLDFSDMPLTDYDDAKHISFMASRGCIRRCYFCSDAPCWPGYRAMSGKRVFEEIAYHKARYPDLGHIKFLDLEFNGNMRSLEEFCDYMIKNPLYIYWSANMVVRPEMTPKVIEKMARAGCEHIIFGIESGSEPLLKRMNKLYRMHDADRIIRDMHRAGICVTANFMFGFPTETEDDFLRTLDFLTRNGKFLSRVYPSRTYFALEELSPICDQPEAFGVIPGKSHLFWESKDGTNTYPLRMDRCRRFCELALSLGVEVGAGVQTSVLQDEWFNLAHYYQTQEEYPKAVENLLRYFSMDSRNEVVNNQLFAYAQKVKEDSLKVDPSVAEQLRGAVEKIENPVSPETSDTCTVTRLDNGENDYLLKMKIKNLRNLIDSREYTEQTRNTFLPVVNGLITLMKENRGFAMQEIPQEYSEVMRTIARKNAFLNDFEFSKGRSHLLSFPPRYFLQ
ncbi:MAG: B12-binding domain-containing radical SAM protein, partial [Candidatus Omnitrophica bacterium]|nr:B12-binding domain-containing radical SAM protein [Candidatus Omnitrophota bacterium]